MARPLRIQFPNAFYHITCRGIERRKIFTDDDENLGARVSNGNIDRNVVLKRGHYSNVESMVTLEGW